MIDMNTGHPNHSHEHELLCMLPLFPKYAPVKSLADDLGLPLARELKPLIQRLKEIGITVSGGNAPVKGAGRALWLERDQWERAQKLAEAYWADVHENWREKSLSKTGSN